MTKLSFSGHESFHCKMHWLKKGYDFVKKGYNFSDLSAVVELGVGKNMVNSIYFWMQSFGLLDENKQLTNFANFIFEDNGKDPYLEDIASLWLLHYYLVKTNKASIYSLVFNEFRRERMEFSKDLLARYIERKCQESGSSFNSHTVERDISVLLRNYVKPKKVKTNLEENYNNLFIELDLIEEVNRIYEKSNLYKIENKERSQLPYQIILFSILDRYETERSISFDRLQFDTNSVGNIFAINTKGLLKKIEEMVDNYKDIVFKDTAGVRELQIKKNIVPKWAVLNNYYEV